MGSFGMAAVVVVVAVIIVLALFAFVTSRIRRVPPNTALVVVGAGGKSANGVSAQKVIIGGRTFVVPVLQQGFEMSLEQRGTRVEVTAVDKNYINTRVTANVNFKVTGTEEGVRRASQRFLTQQGELPQMVQQTLEGSLRSLIGGKPVEDLVQNFAGLAADAIAETKSDLGEFGLQIETLNVQTIDTPNSTYLEDRGRAEAAKARQEAVVKEAESERIAALARIENEQQTNERQLALDLRKSEIKAETDKASEVAEAAGALTRAEQERAIAALEREAVAARAEVAEQQLNIDVRKPAEAEAYAQVQRAEAQRDSRKAEVEAEAYTTTQRAEANKTAAENQAAADVAAGEARARIEQTTGEAQAAIVKATGEAEAAVVQAKGDAEAAAIQAKGVAQADATQKLNDARNSLTERGLAAQAVGQLPAIAREVASGYAQIGEVKIISTDGASAATKEIAGGIAGAFDVVQAATGLDVAGVVNGKAVLSDVAASRAAEGAPAAAPASDASTDATA